MSSHGNGNAPAVIEHAGIKYYLSPEPTLRQFANPAPLGLSAFALTTFVLSLMNAGTRGITIHNVITGLAFFYGGLTQLLAGMWEFACGNTFGATAFSSYGAFWLSFGAILTPGFNIIPAYTSANAVSQLESALGLYLIGWMLFTFILFIACLRSSIGIIALFGFLTMTFALLAAGKLVATASIAAKLTKTGGIFGVITAFIAWYNALAGMLTKETHFLTLPVGPIARSKDGSHA